MPVVVVCPGCKSKLKAPDNLIGKAVKCPTCSQAVLVKAPAAAAPAPPPAPVVKKPPRPAPVVEEEPIEEVDPIEDEDEAPRPQKRRREASAASFISGGPTTEKERGTAMWIHLLPIVLGWCCGIGTWISLFMWISKRKESEFIDHHGKTWLNWVINLFVVSFLFGIVAGALQGIGAASGSGTVAMIVGGLMMVPALALSITILVMQISMALKAKKGEWAEYKVLFKVMK